MANQRAETHPRGDLQSCLTSRLLDVALWGRRNVLLLCWVVCGERRDRRYGQMGICMFVCGCGGYGGRIEAEEEEDEVDGISRRRYCT